MIRILAAAGLAIATLGCGSTLRETDSQAGARGPRDANAIRRTDGGTAGWVSRAGMASDHE